MNKKLEILTYPNEILGKRSTSVDVITEDIVNMLNEMVRVSIDHRGAGLAAPQVGILKRMVVITMPDEDPLLMINPKIIARSQKKIELEEGCLSLPGVTGKVMRNASLELEYTDYLNVKHVEFAEGFFAECIQHEVDHLDGKLYIDKMSISERAKIIKEYFAEK